MEILDLKPGPEVGEAYRFLLDLRLDEGPLPTATAEAPPPRVVGNPHVSTEQSGGPRAGPGVSGVWPGIHGRRSRRPGRGPERQFRQQVATGYTRQVVRSDLVAGHDAHTLLLQTVCSRSRPEEVGQ